ncbi:hypothetical protein CIL03_11455 [Virgibacillus indicus]|uniref:SGNH hydrolase-type esterase domain-containing protein n=1 Tax=Virgibacillus indicus TaxID=2024554 RepID=A0A265N9W4_9BACI|nr:SGNH/GDSL hydrolase family protein [Virgibacillus indicus]OZU88264.1 hypothetical protein CIL03_11455 [Virgibacillus indicus]
MEINHCLINHNFFKGCLHVVEVQDGFIPVRFTRKQLYEFSKEERYWPRIRCLAGISLEFSTSTAFIKFRFTMKNFVRNWLHFDVYINDAFYKSAEFNPIKDGYNEFYLELPPAAAQLNKVVIYFPHNLELVIHQFEISDHAVFNPVENLERSLLCLGDSITQGMDALHPSAIYPAILARTLKMNLLNQGVGGHVFDAKCLDEHLPYKPDIITVAYGTNDWGRCDSITQFRDNCSDFFQKLSCCFPAADIFVITPVWRSDWKERKLTGSFSDVGEVIEEVCSSYQRISIINGLDLIAHQSTYYNSDGVHPNDEGFSKMAAALTNEILK